jgi:uncharacterized membrane protein
MNIIMILFLIISVIGIILGLFFLIQFIPTKKQKKDKDISKDEL